MNRLPTTALLGCVLALSACSSAPKPHEISAIYVPPTRYEHYSCDQLINEAESIKRATPALEAAVDQHRSSQTGVEIVTWILFWPAAFALDKGTEYSQPLAQAKGDLQAIQAAATAKRCGQQLAIVDAPPEATLKDVGTITPSTMEATPNSTVSSDASSRLRALEQLRNDGLITQDEYIEKRTEIVRSL